MTRTDFPPLALDRHNKPFDPPAGAIRWKVRRFTSGRPVAVKRDGRALLLDLNASMEELEEEIDWQTGVYRLYPVDENDNEIPHAQVAHIVISAPEADTSKQDYLSRLDRTYDVVDRLIASHEHKDVLLSDITKSLVKTQTDLQRTTGEILNAANTTIRVANGVEGLERQPPSELDESTLRGVLEEMLEQQTKPQSSGTPWFVQLITGPIGTTAMQIFQNFMATVLQAQVAQAQAAQARAESKA